MAADDSCGPAIDFDNTGCLRISGHLFFVLGIPFRFVFLPFRRPSLYPFTPFFLLSVPVPLPSAPLAFRFRLLSVCCRFPLLRSEPPILLRYLARMHFGILQKTPKATRKGPPLVERVDPQLLTPRQPRDASPPSRGCCPRVSSGPASVRRHSKPCGWPALR